MPVPFPTDDRVDLSRPSAAEVLVLSRGVVTAITPPAGLTALQGVLMTATFEALTDHAATLDAEPLGPVPFAEALARRNEAFRSRMLQMMLLGALVLRPIPPEVTAQISRYADELGVSDAMLGVANRFAEGSLGLASFDFARNGYTAGWAPDRSAALHTSTPLASAWAESVHDVALADRWRALEDLPEGTIGRAITEFYRARGFAYPGQPGSAPPLLAQHDWVHVLADFGTTVESELEVFAFIARANDDPRAFSLLAMVVSLFETGYLASGAGLFESFPGQLSREGVAVRVADAMLRGAKVHGSVDFLELDWFAVADQSVEAFRDRYGLTPKSTKALAAGSVGPWEAGGISEFQDRSGRAAAEAAGVAYEAFGASVG